MYPVIPLEILLGGWEALCCLFTLVAAMLSCFVSLRG